MYILELQISVSPNVSDGFTLFKFSMTGLWPHAYARHILNPDQLENNAQPTSVDRPNSLPNGSFRSPNGLEMGNTGQGQALDFMEAGRRYQ